MITLHTLTCSTDIYNRNNIHFKKLSKCCVLGLTFKLSVKFGVDLVVWIFFINLYGGLGLIMKNLELVSCFDVCLGNDEIKDKKICEKKIWCLVLCFGCCCSWVFLLIDYGAYSARESWVICQTIREEVNEDTEWVVLYISWLSI